jgi:hypothetical protein
MSHFRNIDSLNNKQGEFQPGIKPSEPSMKGGVSENQSSSHNLFFPWGMLTLCQHQLGVKASPNDRAPEFHAQTLPPGTAPAGSSYQPNPIHEIPSQANNEDILRSHGKESKFTKPLDTFPGATSRDVHTGLGKPPVGQSSVEQRHDGQHGRKKETSGYEGVGKSGHPKHADQSIGDSQLVDERYLRDQRGIDREEAQGGQHGDKGSLAAEDIRPETAETVANERDRQRR